MTLLDSKHQAKLYWAGVILYFCLFSFHTLATSLVAMLVGVKWHLLTSQEQFSITVAILANWTGMVLIFLQKGMSRLVSGKPPVATSETEHIAK